MDDAQLEMILDRIDYDRNGEINYSEFLSGTINEEHLNRDNLQNLFRYLDVLREEHLTKGSLLKVFQRSNKDISEDELEEMMREVELSPDE